MRPDALRKLPPLLWLFLLPAVAQAHLTFTTNNGAITITGYTGSDGNVVIPANTNGYPVTAIGTNAFQNITTITNVTIGTNVTSIGDFAFNVCTGLTSVTDNGTIKYILVHPPTGNLYFRLKQRCKRRSSIVLLLHITLV